jgi:hypothetical protein
MSRIIIQYETLRTDRSRADRQNVSLSYPIQSLPVEISILGKKARRTESITLPSAGAFELSYIILYDYIPI